MLEYSSYGARNRHLGGPTTDAGETPSPLEKLLLNSRENAVGSQTPRAYLLELASVASLTLPTPTPESESGTQLHPFTPSSPRADGGPGRETPTSPDAPGTASRPARRGRCGGRLCPAGRRPPGSRGTGRASRRSTRRARPRASAASCSPSRGL